MGTIQAASESRVCLRRSRRSRLVSPYLEPVTGCRRLSRRELSRVCSLLELQPPDFNHRLITVLTQSETPVLDRCQCAARKRNEAACFCSKTTSWTEIDFTFHLLDNTAILMRQRSEIGSEIICVGAHAVRATDANVRKSQCETRQGILNNAHHFRQSSAFATAGPSKLRHPSSGSSNGPDRRRETKSQPSRNHR